MTDPVKVGFAGVGLMGRGMAGNILAKGYPLTVLGHRNRAPVEELTALGAAEAATPKELAAASDIVILCMPNSRVVERVCLGADGIIEGAKPGTLVLDTSTAEPASTKRVAAALAEKGIDFIDTPMTMTPKEAMEGTLNVLVGGPDALVEKARPVLECYARNIFHIGPLGAAHSLKLINNFMSMSMSALVAEAATTARAAGVDLGKLREVVSAGAVNSGMFQKIMAYAVDGDASGLQFAMANARKDVGYYNDIAAEAGLPAPFGSAALQLYTLACATGHGEEHVPLLVDVMAELGGLNGAGK
ncbi:NAD(P)-dependent oxidoreductase [Thalassobaculum salexigens]|uniref:NAD(P)-dependent oxidoreductase n=1 Tax=Thalassobaculum salexigens TaxID=455360 RepID=UPI000404C9FA|nr:NAD(P)-dependent oxidoreductase [Thalassobaculum salexigens]